MDDFNLTNEKKITQKEWEEFQAFKKEYQENESTRNLLLQNINDTLSGRIRSSNIIEYRNTYIFNGIANLDSTYPYIIDFELIDEMTKLVECKVSFKKRNARYTISNPEGETEKPSIASSTYLAVGMEASPYIHIYKRSGDTFTKLTNPVVLPTSGFRDLDFSPDGTYLAGGCTNSPYIYIYKRSGDTFTKLSNPSTLPTGYVYGVSFSYDNTYLAVAHEDSPYVTIYKRDGDTFTKLANPTTLPTGNGVIAKFSNYATYLSITHYTSPYKTIYKRSGDTFTKLDDGNFDVGIPSYAGWGSDFSPNTIYLAIGHVGGDYLTIYKRDGDTFTKLTPADSEYPPDGVKGIDFSNDNTYLACAVYNRTPYIYIYKRSGDTFTKLSNPSTLPTGSANRIKFSNNYIYLAITHATTPFVTIYKRSGDTFTKLSNPSDLPTYTGLGLAWSYQ